MNNASFKPYTPIKREIVRLLSEDWELHQYEIEDALIFTYSRNSVLAELDIMLVEGRLITKGTTPEGYRIFALSKAQQTPSQRLAMQLRNLILALDDVNDCSGRCSGIYADHSALLSIRNSAQDALDASKLA